MAGWDDVLKELGQTPSPQDFVRRDYLSRLSKYTGRNTIAYYSAWLSKGNVSGLDIIDSDMTGFMNAVKGLDCSKGLDHAYMITIGTTNASKIIENQNGKAYISQVS